MPPYQPTDSDFEKSLASLAFANLRDRAPGLFDYLVGFQVLEANEEQTKAVGVFACHVGSEWVYLPTFFNNGELKGQSLMYLKTADRFIPLDEAWVTFVLNKKPMSLGEASDTTRSQISKNGPDLSPFHITPGTFGKSGAYMWQGRGVKLASLQVPVFRSNQVQLWAHDIQKQLTRPFYKEALYIRSAQNLDLANFLHSQGQEATESFGRNLVKNAAAAEMVLKFYTPEQLAPWGFPLGSHLKKKAADHSAFIEQQARKSVGTENPYPSIQPGSGPEFMDQIGPLAVFQTSDPANPFYTIDTREPKGSPNSLKTHKNYQEMNAWHLQRRKIPWDANQPPHPSVAHLFTKESSDSKLKANDPKAPDKVEKKPHNRVIEDTDEVVEEGAKKLDYAENAPTGMPDVQILLSTDLDTPKIAAGLTDAEKTKLLQGEVVIKDHRDNTSKTYAGDTEKTLGNPSDSGVYKALIRGKGFADMLIIQQPIPVGGGDVNITGILAIEIANKAFALVPSTAVAVRDNVDPRATFFDFYKDLTKPESMSAGKCYLLVTPDGKGTLPFKIMKRKVSTDGTVELWVKDYKNTHYYGHCDPTKRDTNRDNRPCIQYCRCDGACTCDAWATGRHIVLSDQPGSLKNIGDTLFVPVYAKAMAVDRKADLSPLGDPFDVKTFILSNNLATPLKVYSRGGDEYDVTAGEDSAKNLNKMAALKHLVLLQGLTGEDAVALLKEAELHQTARTLVAYAGGYPLSQQTFEPMNAAFRKAGERLGPGPSAPAIPDDDVHGSFGDHPATWSNPRHLQVQDMIPQPGNRNYYDPDPRKDQYLALQPTQLAQAASSTGQKDVFDAAIMSQLLKTTDPDSKIDSYASDMMLGLDRCGRTLFLYYAFPSAFKDRYGSSQLEQIEDGLKNAFSGLGEVVLTLRQTTVDGAGEDQATDVDLGNTVSSSDVKDD